MVGDAGRLRWPPGCSLTMPGTPMIFAGDELGLTGGNGEGRVPRCRGTGRRPGTSGRSPRTGRCSALRGTHPALRHGGLRWVHVDADTLVFLREAPTGAVLVLARRAAGPPVRLTGLPSAG